MRSESREISMRRALLALRLAARQASLFGQTSFRIGAEFPLQPVNSGRGLEFKYPASQEAFFREIDIGRPPAEYENLENGDVNSCGSSPSIACLLGKRRSPFFC
jgi:hypothetical protein